jgi:uncharacterized lipoprotein NlpE involved in copper resistance
VADVFQSLWFFLHALGGGSGCCGLFAGFRLLFLPLHVPFTTPALLHFIALSSHISFALLSSGCFLYRPRNMNIRAGRFNIILAVLLCPLVACETPEKKKEDPKKEAAMIRFFLESNPDETGRTMQVPVYRRRPMLVTVQRDPVLDEGYLEHAEVVDADDMGGLAIKLTFNADGTRRLDAVTIEHRGFHFAIEAVWTEERFIAAPLITKRISNGEFVFTPDASREEAERIVLGLKHVIERLHEKYTF